MRGFRVVLMLTAMLSAEAWALTVDEIDIGEQIRGPVPKMTSKDFLGKVVLVDLWGIRCVPCIAEMPANQALYAKYRFAGFHIVALERQGKTNGEAFEFFANNPMFAGPQLQFQFSYSGRTPIPGRYVANLPANFLFNADGYMIGSDLHGEVLESKVQEALVDCLAGITQPGDIGRLADYEARLKTGLNLMATLSEVVRKKRETKDPKVIEEATKLFTGVFDWANKKYNRAVGEREKSPMAALMRFKTIARELKGTDIAAKSAEAVEELLKDDRVLREQKADKALHDIVTQYTDMKSLPDGSKDPQDVEFRKLNLPALRTMAADCAQLMYVFPNTEAAAHTQTIIDEFRLNDKELK